jgi:hypothetical protein
VDVPQARQIARPAWLNLRTTLGVLLFSLAFLAGQRALQGARTTTAVWAAAGDLASGEALGDGDVVAVDVRLPDELLARYVSAAVDVSGRVLTRAVGEGELIAGGWVAQEAAFGSRRALTLPLTSEHGAGGQQNARQTRRHRCLEPTHDQNRLPISVIARSGPSRFPSRRPRPVTGVNAWAGPRAVQNAW